MKLLCLMSGGIDSPVAAWMMKGKGYDVKCIHFRVGSAKKVKLLAKKVGCKLKVKRHASTLKKIQKKCDVHYTCVLCKRAMLTGAARYARRWGFDALLTGDNLGQVASQTIDNLGAEGRYVNLPVIRPLIGLNKQEIVDIAKKIGTYELSIRGAAKCPFVPRRPATHSDLDVVDREWKKLK